MTKKKSGRGASLFFIILTVIFALYLIVPFMATVFFSFAEKWTDTIIPESWTLDHYKEIFASTEFYQSLGRTLILATVTSLIQVFITMTVVLGMKLRHPKWATFVELLSIIPIALPGVVLALGNINFYGVVWPNILGTPFLLCCVQIGFGFPFSYRTVTNAFRSFKVQDLYNAAKTLGCGLLPFIFRVVIPSIKQGLLISLAMSFATVVDCFALQQLITGAGWQTYVLYEYKNLDINGHVASGLIVISLSIIFLVSLLASVLNRRKKARIVA